MITSQPSPLSLTRNKFLSIFALTKTCCRLQVTLCTLLAFLPQYPPQTLLLFRPRDSVCITAQPPPHFHKHPLCHHVTPKPLPRSLFPFIPFLTSATMPSSKGQFFLCLYLPSSLVSRSMKWSRPRICTGRDASGTGTDPWLLFVSSPCCFFFPPLLPGSSVDGGCVIEVVVFHAYMSSVS